MTAVMLRSSTPRVSSTIAVLWLLFTSRRQASNLLLFAYEARALTRLSYPGIFNEDPWTGARDPLNCCPWACYIGQGLNDFRSMVKMLRHLGGPRMTEVRRTWADVLLIAARAPASEPKVRIELTPRTYHVRALTSRATWALPARNSPLPEPRLLPHYQVA